ncbi:MAG: T9SS type A sorting domain-containing protein [Ignavibacteriales bacterium]|nr:T9SS type A sorting domain-containing protein [Ignavibacteriales bacterium]
MGPLRADETGGGIALFAPSYVVEGARFEVIAVSPVEANRESGIAFILLAERKLDFQSALIQLGETSYEAIPSSYFNADVNAWMWRFDVPGEYLSAESERAQLFAKFRAPRQGAAVARAFIIPDTQDVVFRAPDDAATAVVQTYRPTSASGSALLLESDDEMIMRLESFGGTDGAIGWWTKIDGETRDLFKLVDPETGEREAALHVNADRMAIFDGDYERFVSFRSAYAAFGAWNYFLVVYKERRNSLQFYLNGFRFAEYRLPGFSDGFASYETSFAARGERAGALIDMLKIWDVEASVPAYLKKRRFRSGASDSARPRLQFTFDGELPDLDGETSVKAMGGRLVPSDAPIVSAAPEASATLLGDAYLIEWSGGDARAAKRYRLDRAFQGEEFATIFETDAQKDPEARYRYVDGAPNNQSVVYYRVAQISDDGSTTYSSRLKIGRGDAKAFELLGNYPNPFNPRTSIRVEMLRDAVVVVEVHSLDGERIAILHSGPLAKGEHQFQFDGSELTSGIYLATVRSETGSRTRKMILAK